MDEFEIEVFRADTRASRGITAAQIADVAAFDCEAHPIPCVIGHPKSDSPAEGTIKAFRADGAKLFATVAGVSQKLLDGIKNSSIINRSMAFFSDDHEANPTPGKLAPRHLGFLGGSAPGIPGMDKLSKALTFAAGDDEITVDGDPAPAIVYNPPATPVFQATEEPSSMETPEQKADREARETKLAADQKKLDDDRTAFEADRDKSRKAANKTRVAALVTAGRVLPANSADLETVFNALDDGELTFAADDDKGQAADKLAAIIGGGPALVDTSGKPLTKGEFTAASEKPTDAKGIESKARAMMEEDKSLSFEAAVEKVSEGKEG